MRFISFLALSLATSIVPSNSAEPKAPPLIGDLPEQSEGPTQFGPPKHGIQIGFSQPKESYQLNHQINIWIVYEAVRPRPVKFELGGIVFEAARPMPKNFQRGEDTITLTHPDGSVSKFRGDNRIDGPIGPSYCWCGGLSDQLHYYSRTPGVYKMQWKLGDVESAVVSWRMVP